MAIYVREPRGRPVETAARFCFRLAPLLQFVFSLPVR
jgi:hypothetical protein